MARQDVRLSDRFDLGAREVLLNGTQALVRLMLMQKARDKALGLNTAGYVTGYRGSPLGGVDQQMTAARELLQKSDIRFQAGLNEDLAATALWGTQQAELRGQGRYDGVFGMFYGKGPGIDRTGDVFRHANFAGTSPHGGVLVAMGDDHTCESSTTLHQSDWAAMDAYIPVLSPAGVQEILDYGLFGIALSRFAGVWAGLKLIKDTVEVTSVVDGRPDRLSFLPPAFEMPEGGLNIRLGDTPVAMEARLVDHKRHAAEAFGRANGINRRVWGAPGAKIGFAAAGKNWLDLVHALDLLGIDEDRARELGLTTYKIGMTWPLDAAGLREWAEGLDLIVVVEEKRKILESQVKEILYGANGPRVWGAEREGEVLFPVRYALDPVQIAARLGEILTGEGRSGFEEATARLQAAERQSGGTDLAQRTPYFCAGCPHNTSTRVPDGSRAYAGIGCHYLVQLMDRETQGFTHMGGEGANWIGEALFSKTEHVFQNMGDGTYNHSGAQAIRAAIASGTTMTYKILFNDAVAMTGGQKNDGGLTPAQIAHELAAMGVSELVVVHDPAEPQDPAHYPTGIAIEPRDQLGEVQERLRKVRGVSALIYVQTCAAEKRRRRRRGVFPDPDRRVFINPDICEGCGDCGVQSNCVAILPHETELGRKRRIDQSACNKDFSCLKGFCPSFVTVEGGTPRPREGQAVDLKDLPEPTLPEIQGQHNIVITGIGGTGAVTIGAVLAMAAHLDGRGAAMMEMAGLAQKGGSVQIHCRIAETPGDIAAVRVSLGEADTVIGGDMVVTSGAKTMALMAKGRTKAVINAHETPTGAFTRITDFRLPVRDMERALADRIGNGLTLFDSSALAERLLGDAIFSNMMLLGAAWQAGLVPVSAEAIDRAIELNGTAIDKNRRAFKLGRWAIAHPEQAREMTAPEPPKSLAERIDFRAEHLTKYQSRRLAKRYRRMVERFEDDELKAAVAEGYHKLLAYKDEYEVARLHRDTIRQAEEAFMGDLKLTYHLAPPGRTKTGPDGRPAKRDYSPRVQRLFWLLARMKGLRGTAFDPFGGTEERKMERELIRIYETDMVKALKALSPETREPILELARLPLSIKGFGPVKLANAKAAAARRKALWAAINTPPEALQTAAE